MLVQPGQRCLREALHAGRGDHAIERLKEGPDDDTELMGAEELRASLAKSMDCACKVQAALSYRQQDKPPCPDLGRPAVSLSQHSTMLGMMGITAGVMGN